MRLVWVVIPLVLIGFVGVQEAYPQESIWKYSDFVIQGGKIISIEDNLESSSTILQTEMYEDGYIITPKLNHISTKSDCTIQYNNFFILIDNEEIDIEINKKEQNMKIKIPKNTKNVEIIMSFILPPHTLSTTFAQFCKNLDEGKHLSPVEQMKIGFQARDIICKNDLILIYHKINESACIKPDSIQKLIEREWVNGLIKSRVLKNSVDVYGHQVSIKYSSTANFKISEIIETEHNTLYIKIDSKTKGKLVIELPRYVIDAKKIHGGDDSEFIILIKGEEMEYNEISSTVDTRTLIIPFEHEVTQIEIFGVDVI